MIQLLFSLAGLLLGPICYLFSRRRELLYGFLDGFVLVGVAGLILTELLPETIESAGYLALLAAAAGLVLPFLLERRLALLPFSPNAFFRWLMILGLLLHQMLDGVALNPGFSQPWGQSLQLAVILHQIPKGFFIWGLVGEAMGHRVGYAVFGSLCLATLSGFGLGDKLANLMESRLLWLFQAFIGGGLLHVIIHHVPEGAGASSCSDGACCGDSSADSRKFSYASGAGALLSLCGLIWMHRPLEGSPEPGGFLATFTSLSLESAPSILLGFAAAGLFQASLSRVIFNRFRVKGRMSQALRGIAVGVPLPICSCGVVPVYLSLLKKSVPPAAALAFLIATPEIGIDSLFLSGKLLGMEITLIRMGMAFLIALGVAILLARTFEKIQMAGDLDSLKLPQERVVPPTAAGKLREALRFGGMELIDHTGAWLLLGIAIASAMGPTGWEDWIQKVPPPADVLILSLLGLPIYVCASGATPLAAMFIQNGVSTGAALAFLITGPSTNVTTFGILKRYHGLKGAILFAATVYGFSIAIGFAINYLFPDSTAPIGDVLAPDGTGTIEIVSAAILCLLFAGSILRLGPRGFLATLGESFVRLPGDRKKHDHGH